MLAAICERIAARARARDAATIFLLEEGRLVPRSLTPALTARTTARRGTLHARRAAAGRGRSAVQSGKPVVARDPASPLIPPSWVGRASASARRSPCRSAAGPERSARWCSTTPRRTGSRREAVALRRDGRRARRSARSSRRSRATSARSHLRAATAIRQAARGGRERRLRPGGRRGAGARDPGRARRRARDAACSRTRTSEIEHVISVGADGDFERVLRGADREHAR